MAALKLVATPFDLMAKWERADLNLRSRAHAYHHVSATFEHHLAMLQPGQAIPGSPAEVWAGKKERAALELREAAVMFARVHARLVRAQKLLTVGKVGK